MCMLHAWARKGQCLYITLYMQDSWCSCFQWTHGSVQLKFALGVEPGQEHKPTCGGEVLGICFWRPCEVQHVSLDELEKLQNNGQDVFLIKFERPPRERISRSEAAVRNLAAVALGSSSRHPFFHFCIVITFTTSPTSGHRHFTEEFAEGWKDDLFLFETWLASKALSPSTSVAVRWLQLSTVTSMWLSYVCMCVFKWTFADFPCTEITWSSYSESFWSLCERKLPSSSATQQHQCSQIGSSSTRRDTECTSSSAVAKVRQR